MGGILGGVKKVVRGGYDDEDIEVRVESQDANHIRIVGACKTAVGDVDCDLTLQEIDGKIVQSWGNPGIADHRVNLKCQEKAVDIAKKLWEAKK